MRRYRRLEKSINDSVPNSCNGLYLSYASTAVPRKPNIISRNSCLKKIIHTGDEGSITAIEAVDDAVRGLSATRQSVDSSMYYLLNDGSVMIENSSIIQPNLDDYQFNDGIQSSLNFHQGGPLSRDGQIDEVDNQEIHRVVDDQSNSRKQVEDEQSGMTPPTSEIMGDSHIDVVPVVEDRDDTDTCSAKQAGQNSDPTDDSPDESQYVVLQMGTQTLLVPVATFRQYCDAQQSGDAQSVANFFCLVEQALVDPNGDFATELENSSLISSVATSNKSSSAHSVGLSVATEEIDELPLIAPLLANEITPTEAEPRLNNIRDVDTTSDVASNVSLVSATNDVKGKIDKEPAIKKLKEDDEMRAINFLSSKKQLAAKSVTGSTKKENINIFRCGTCTMLFATKDLCMQHIYIVHKADPLKTHCDLRRTNETRFICHGCSRTFGSLAEFHMHNQSTHGSNNSLIKEEISLKSNDHVVGDEVVDKIEKKTKISPNCQWDNKKASLSYPNSFDCCKCSKTFVSLYYYLLHGLLHMETTCGWICQICSDRFSSKPNLVEHFRVHCEIKCDTDLNAEGSVTKTRNGELFLTDDTRVSNAKILNALKEPKNSQPGGQDCHETVEPHQADILLRRRGRRKISHVGKYCNSSVGRISLQLTENSNETPDTMTQLECSEQNSSTAPRPAAPTVKLRSFLTEEIATDSSVHNRQSELMEKEDGQTRGGEGTEIREISRSSINDELVCCTGSHSVETNDQLIRILKESTPVIKENIEDKGISTVKKADKGLKRTVVKHRNRKISIEDVTGTNSQGVFSRSLRSARKNVEICSSPSVPCTRARNSINTKVSSRMANKTGSVEVWQKSLSKELPPKSVRAPTSRRTRRNLNKQTLTAPIQGSSVNRKQDEIKLISDHSAAKPLVMKHSQVSYSDNSCRNDDNGRKSKVEKSSSSVKVVKGSKSLLKEAPLRLRSRIIPSAEVTGRRVRKNATASRELLPEDGPRFELHSTKSKPNPPTRKKHGLDPSGSIANPENRCRVQQSFIEIFNKVKKTGDSGRVGRHK